MQITVDTKKDSDEDIRKAIRFLQTLIGDRPNSDSDSGSANNIFNDDAPTAPSGGMMGMFGDSPQTYSDDDKKEDDDSPSIVSNDNDEIQVIPY